MGIRFRLVRENPSIQAEYTAKRARDIWKLYYRPPWKFTLHLIELVCIISYAAIVATPSITNVYHARYMFTKHFYPVQDDNVPFFRLVDISDFYDRFLTNLEKLYTDSFLSLYYVDPKKPYIFKILWNNGTITEDATYAVTMELFQHIQYIQISSSFFTTSLESDIIGCSQWEAKIIIQASRQTYTFKTIPVVDRFECSKDIVTSKNGFVRWNKRASDEDEILFIKKIKEQIEAGDFEQINNAENQSNNNDEIDSTINQEIPPVIHRNELSLYYSSQRLSFLLFAISIIRFFVFMNDISRRFTYHRIKLQTNVVYEDIEFSEQLHSTIGYWPIFNLLNSIVGIICSSIMMIDSTKFTQFPSAKALKAFAFPALLAFVECLNWFKRMQKVYRLVVLTRIAIVPFINIFISLFPLAVSMIFICIFLFGHVSKLSISLWKVMEFMIALTFGDMMLDFYRKFSDGSQVYNTLSFIFITMMSIVLIWLFFTTFTATMTNIHRSFVRF